MTKSCAIQFMMWLLLTFHHRFAKVVEKLRHTFDHQKMENKKKQSLNTCIPYIHGQAKTVFFTFGRTSSVYKLDILDFVVNSSRRDFNPSIWVFKINFNVKSTITINPWFELF